MNKGYNYAENRKKKIAAALYSKDFLEMQQRLGLKIEKIIDNENDIEIIGSDLDEFFNNEKTNKKLQSISNAIMNEEQINSHENKNLNYGIPKKETGNKNETGNNKKRLWKRKESTGKKRW